MNEPSPNNTNPSRVSLRLKLAARLIVAFAIVAALPMFLLNWMPGNWLLAFLVTLIFAIGLTIFITGRVSRPLERLNEAARRLELGDGDGSLDLALDPDVGDIAKVINKMVKAASGHSVRIEQRTKALQALVNLSGAFLESMDLNVTMQSALREAVAATHADMGGVFLVAADGTKFQPVAEFGTEGGEDRIGNLFPIDAHTAPGYGFMMRRTIISPDLSSETRFHVFPAILELGVTSTMITPMLIDRRVVGVITIDTKKAHEFSPEEINAVQAIANHTAIAVERIKLLNELSDSYNRILVSLVKALDTRDRETEGHSQRVVAYSRALADVMGVDGNLRLEIERGALLHDIGKIGVPDAILHKSGGLSDAEWETVRQHPLWGKQILDGIGFLRGAAEIVMAHHERWDGKGYPNTLQGDQIPIGARIFAVADAFDAMTSYRPYRDPQTFQKARDEIRQGSGNQFDPEVVAAFLKFNRDDWVKLREQSEAGQGAGDIGSLRRISSGQLQSMNLIIAAITSSLDLDEVLQQCVKTITAVTRVTAVGIYILDNRRGELSFAAGANLPEVLQSQNAADLASQLGLEQIRQGVTQFRTDGLAHFGKGWRSILILPLQDGERATGALALLSAAPVVLNDDERILFDHVAKQLGQAIVNARVHEKVRVQAITDALTGAYNRHYLDEFLNIEVKRCQRYKRPLALVMLDMDRFKDCNDAAGHQAGDKALQDVVHLLNLGVRSVDFVSRYGGEEFLVVLPETDAEGALEAAERIRRLIEKHQYPCGKLTASIGVAATSYLDGDAPDAVEFIARADKALFESKAKGKNMVTLWGPN